MFQVWEYNNCLSVEICDKSLSHTWSCDFEGDGMLKDREPYY